MRGGERDNTHIGRGSFTSYSRCFLAINIGAIGLEATSKEHVDTLLLCVDEETRCQSDICQRILHYFGLLPASITHHNVILFRIVRVFLRWDFKHRRNRFVVILQYVSNVVGNVLVDENDTNIIAGRKILEGFFHQLQLCVLFDYQKVGATGSAVSNSGQKKTRDGIL